MLKGIVGVELGTEGHFLVRESTAHLPCLGVPHLDVPEHPGEMEEQRSGRSKKNLDDPTQFFICHRLGIIRLKVGVKNFTYHLLHV